MTDEDWSDVSVHEVAHNKVNARPTYGGGLRPGMSGCECNDERHYERDASGYSEKGCPRYGHMHDGWFICGPCVRHAKKNGQIGV